MPVGASRRYERRVEPSVPIVPLLHRLHMADDPFLVRDAHNPEVGLAALPEGENMLNVVVLSDVHTNMQDISRASAELGRRGVRCDHMWNSLPSGSRFARGTGRPLRRGRRGPAS